MDLKCCRQNDIVSRMEYTRVQGVDTLELTNENSRMLLVDSAVLPKVFSRVVEAKQLLASGKATSAAQAARIAGISRSAFYKYRSAVYVYDAQKAGRILTLHIELSDRPGILSRVLSEFADTGTNILTVNQNIPAQGKALVSISARIDDPEFEVSQFVKRLSTCDGVERVLRISGQQN
ncbi:MAG: ACT domain-containing protein [Oscillospiraceae bacterium]|jgi:chorismate mutase|nr:ACT domain-containing protein [Oscillospiraceae bacterium]